jgi:hypothetical protein
MYALVRINRHPSARLEKHMRRDDCLRSPLWGCLRSIIGLLTRVIRLIVKG